MFGRTTTTGCALAIILGLWSSTGEAALDIQLQRLSDTKVRITGSGVVDFTNDGNAFLVGSVYDGTFDGSLGTLGFTIGGVATGLDLTPTVPPAIPAQATITTIGAGPWSQGAVPSGFSIIEITSGSAVFAAIGTSGVLLTDIDEPAIVGAYTITPIPAALPLLASGLGALGIVAWRRRASHRPERDVVEDRAESR